MGTKITELTATSYNAADYVAVANATDGTRKMLISDLKSAMAGLYTFADDGSGNITITTEAS